MKKKYLAKVQYIVVNATTKASKLEKVVNMLSSTLFTIINMYNKQIIKSITNGDTFIAKWERLVSLTLLCITSTTVAPINAQHTNKTVPPLIIS